MEGVHVKLTDYQKILSREDQSASELMSREAEWDVIEEVSGYILDPKSYRDLYDVLSYAARKWLADNGWADCALDRLKYINPTETEMEAAEREAREDTAYLHREWARGAI